VHLQAHIGRELVFALGRAIEPDRTVKIFVAGVIGALHPAEDLQRMKECVKSLRAQGIEGID
tara:strand:+ start:2183 stop:2368 length:186 start_codon:yes stop_codon:yes gene_type:complete